MSRDASGTYSLPAGNPVVTGTTITSSWANNTMNDIASALTDSLSRSGQGSMTAGLKLASGTSALPGLSWSAETTSGLYRAGAGDFRWVISTNELLKLTAASTTLTSKFIVSADHTDAQSSFAVASNIPSFDISENDGAANNRRWNIVAIAEQLRHRLLSDDGLTATNWLTIDRTGTTVDTINFANGTLQYGGLEIGYRNLIQNIQSGNYTVVTGDRGKSVVYGGAGGHTYTIDTTTEDNSIVTIINGGTGNLTIAGSGVTVLWYNGSGTISSGSRSLAVGGVATILKTGTTNVRLWGTGLS